MSVKNRIKEYCKAEKLSISAFEESIGVSNGYVNAISKSIGIDKLNTIIEKYSNLNIEWLLTGKGSMLKDAPLPIAHQVNGQENLDLSQQSLALPKSLPYIKYEHLADLHFPLDPECKYDGASTTRKFIECRAQFVTEYRQQDALPIIPPGSSVACKTISKDDVIDKALCLLILNGNVLIRKVSFGFDKEHYNTTNINGENPLELAKSEVLSIHRIMAYLVTYP